MDGFGYPILDNLARKHMNTQSLQSPLYLTGTGYTITISQDAETLKKELLESSAEIVKVTDVGSALSAQNQRRDITRMLSDVEKYREIIKRPVLQKGREIDQIARDFVKTLEDEKERIGGLLASFSKAEEEKRQAAALEAQRLAQESARLEQERIAKELEADKRRVYAQNALEWAETPQERILADKEMKEAQARQEEADKLQAQQEEAQRQSFGSSMIATTPAMKGSAKPVLDYILENVAALYAGAPHLVELAPKRREILAELKRQQDAVLEPKIPGLKVTENWKVR